MNIIPDELENSPFGDDFFNRRVVADNLTSLIQNNEKSLVISLNGAWGEGKTYFVNNWVKYLQEQNEGSNIIPILYNAFENDFSDDVFISIAVEIENALEKAYGEDWLRSERWKKLKEQGKELASDLILLSSSSLIELKSGWSFRSLLAKWNSEAKRFDLNKNKALVDKKFDGFFTLKGTIQKYRNRLTESLNFEKDEKKILFIIDELDRCRPDYALQVIESIKHLFNVSNVHFVLAVNKSQLLSCIEHAYGVSGKDSKVYWQKFFHIEASLPSVKNLSIIGDQNSSIEQFILNRIGAHELQHQIIDPKKISWLLRFVNGKGKIELVPRSIERVFQYYTVIATSNEFDFMERHWRVIFLLVLLRLEASVYYDDIRGNKGEIKENRFGSNSSLRKISGISLSSFVENLTSKYLTVEDYTDKSSNQIELVNFKSLIDKIELYDIPYENSEDYISKKKKSDS